MRGKDFVVDDSIYKPDKITFFCTECTSQRRIADNQDNYLYTCNMANDHFISNGVQAIIPICHLCSTFAFDDKLKPSLLVKNQLREQLAKQ